VRRSLYREAVAAGRRRQRESTVVAGELARLGLPHTDLLLALDTLTPRQRAILVLRFFDDRSEPETADILGLSTGTVRAQARAATTALRRVLPERASKEPRSDVS
jgi:DNA-directed RNA polymerase specialized sigma24 family protein